VRRLPGAARAPRCTHPTSVLTPGKFGKFGKFTPTAPMVSTAKKPVPHQ
jgi:hypothetical protein